MNRSSSALGAMAAITVMAAAAAANAQVVIDVSQSGANVDVTASGSLNLSGATFDHSQPYSTGIIPGGPNWYVALGSTPGMDWYQLTGVNVPFGTSGTYFTSASTSGDAISIWGYAGMEPLVGVSTGYTSGTPISASMVIGGESIASMGLTPGSYVFTLPSDTVTLNILAAGVPEPATWAMLILGLGAIGLALRRRKPALAA